MMFPEPFVYAKIQTHDIMHIKSPHPHTSGGRGATQIRDLLHPVDAVGVKIKLQLPCLADSDALLC
jgi:hypothetical protein